MFGIILDQQVVSVPTPVLITFVAALATWHFTRKYLNKQRRKREVHEPSEPWKQIGRSSFDRQLDETEQLNLEMRESFFLGKSLNFDKRREQLQALKRLMTENKEEIVEALNKDLRRPRLEALLYDYIMVVREIDDQLANFERWSAPEYTGMDVLSYPSTGMKIKVPIGTILLIDTWNYPFMLALMPLASAIAAGCTVVVKPCMVSRACADTLARLLETYMDPEIVSVIGNTQDRDRYFTSELLKCKWDHIFFTGSPSVGKIVMQGAAQHLTPCTLELGGKNPVIVAESADINLAAKRVIWGRMMNSGQQCISPDYVCVVESKKQEFADRCVYWLKQFYGENPQESESIGRMVGDKQFDRVMGMLNQTKGKIICGGKSDKATRYIEPALVMLQGWDDPTIDEETFGPITWVIGVPSVKEAVQIIKRKEKPLSLYLFTNNAEEEEMVIYETDSGGVTINHCLFHAGQHGLGFGGVGNSGMGGYHGRFGFDVFTHTKPVVRKHWWPDGGLYSDLRLLYPPHTNFAMQFFETVLSYV